MIDQAVVRVPASTSNLGAGFDCVGVAVDRWLTIAVSIDDRATQSVFIERGGTLADLRVEPRDDHITLGFRAACRAVGHPTSAPLHIRGHSEIPIGRGLGSSGAAVVAGAAAANVLLDLGLDDRALLAIGSDLEGHPDNVAAAVYGGAVLVLAGAGDHDGELVTAELVVDPALTLVFAIPDFTVETKHARSVLPASVPRDVAVRAAARSAALVHGLATADRALLCEALDDVLHVPFRKRLVRGYDAVTAAARHAGAHGATLSGSGSGVVAVAPRTRADAVCIAMRAAWGAYGVRAACFTTTGRTSGYSAAIDAELPVATILATSPEE